jgi:hypothetical protein
MCEWYLRSLSMLSQAGRAGKGGHRPSSTPWPAVAVAVLSPPTARPLYVTNMKPPKCRLCSGLHWNNEPHVFASNTASNASNNASNRLDPPNGIGLAQPGPRKISSTEKADGGGSGTASGTAEGLGNDSAEVCKQPKQRWTRESYNAYQREYMKEWRKRKSPT